MYVWGPYKILGKHIILYKIRLRKSVTKSFKNKRVVKNLGYRFTRKKDIEGNSEDIYDGEMYKRLCEGDKVLSNKWNFSYVFNTDGCQAAKNCLNK